MSWWKRLLGRSDKPPGPAPKLPPAVPVKRRVPKYIDVLPGELAIRVFVHEIPIGDEGILCWSYVTDGLRRHGQQEMVFTLRRRSEEGEADFPQDPLAFFADVHGLARDGKRVEAGGHTIFTPRVPFLGLNSTVGMAYVPAEDLPGVNYPAPTLAAILLRGDEVHATPVIGSYRVLSLLGGHCRYYPTPPWSDRDRPPVLSRAELEQSLLTRTPTTFL